MYCGDVNYNTGPAGDSKSTSVSMANAVLPPHSSPITKDSLMSPPLSVPLQPLQPPPHSNQVPLQPPMVNQYDLQNYGHYNAGIGQPYSNTPDIVNPHTGNNFPSQHNSTSDESYDGAVDDQAHSMASEHSLYSSEETPYNNGHDDMTVEYEDEELANNPRARVLKHLDVILRDRVNSEFEEFQNNMHSIFDQQLSQIMQLMPVMAISEGDTRSQDEDADIRDDTAVEELCSTSGQDSNMWFKKPLCYEQEQQQPQCVRHPSLNDLDNSSVRHSSLNVLHNGSAISYLDNNTGSLVTVNKEDYEKTKIVLQMLTSASVITRVLRRNEFRT